MTRVVITVPSKTRPLAAGQRNVLLPSNRVLESNVTDYVAHDGSNKIAITADVSDLAALQMLTSPPPEVMARWRRTALSNRSRPTSRLDQAGVESAVSGAFFMTRKDSNLHQRIMSPLP